MGEKTEFSKKMEPVAKPNEKLFRDRIQAETAAIEELKVKINEIQQRISAVVGGRDEYNNEKANRRARLDAVQKQMDELEEQRKMLLDKIQSKQKEGAEMKQSASDMKKKIGFASSEEIDKKVAALEHSMMTSTLSLKEEKQLLEEIKRLKGSKPLLSKYQTLEQSVSNFEGSSVIPLRAMLDEVRTKILELRTQKREESAKYKELLEERQKTTAPGRELIDERDRLSKQMNAHFLNRREAQTELNREIQKHQAYLQQVKRERDERMREERARRQLENERFNLERDLERVECELPYEAECLLLAQTITYLQKLLEAPAIAQDKKEADTKADVVEGALLPKSQRQEVFFYAPKAKKQANKEQDKKKEKPKTLKYDVGTLSYFEQCGVAAPVTLDEIPACVEKLEAKLAKFKGMQAEMTAQVDERKAEIFAKMAALEERVAAQTKKEQQLRDAKKNVGSSTAAESASAAEEEDE